MAAEAVLAHLALNRSAPDVFTTVNKNEGARQVFGGQLMAQAALAAAQTLAATKPLASFHCLFSAAADLRIPINYQVEAVREGRRFSMQRVTASQGDRVCCHMNATFQQPEQGLSFQAQMPAIAAPDQCDDLSTMVAAYQQRFPSHLPGDVSNEPMPAQALDIRFADIESFLSPSTHVVDHLTWVKFNAPVGSDLERHKQVLAYAADQTIAHLVMQPHGLGGLNPNLTLVSLDHALWFHAPFRVDNWLLLVRRCQATGSGRALVTGEAFDQNGGLVASLTQQASIRLSE